MLSFLNGQNIFNQHENKDAIKNILALLMITVVNADKKVTTKEQVKILDFFKRAFSKINKLFRAFDSSMI